MPDITLPKPLSGAELLAGPPLREFMLLVSKDGVGKSSAIISLALFVQMILNPKATFYVIDTENKFRAALQGFGEPRPTNLTLFKCETMNHATEALAIILKDHEPGDWLAVESMSRVWERAQDLGYLAVSGLVKADYLERRREAKGKTAMPVTPQPADLWNITKGAHDGAFLDLISQSETLNAILSSTIARPPKPDAFIKENQQRKDVRQELGIDMGIEGAPRLPYYIQTLCSLELKAGAVSCRILRDNLSTLEIPRVEFPVESKTSWAMSFWSSCR